MQQWESSCWEAQGAEARASVHLHSEVVTEAYVQGEQQQKKDLNFGKQGNDPPIFNSTTCYSAKDNF